MLEESDETILARWLAGELTPEEQRAFEKSENFAEYSAIIQGTNRFLKPAYDKENLRRNLFMALDKPKKEKIRHLKPWFYVVAASILILISLGLFFNEVEYITAKGEKQIVALPDGSRVQLNADSHLKRNRFFWANSKKVVLVRGEGFFEVDRSNGFQVMTTEGDIQVLGTKFNVKYRTNDFEVACYQGTVQFIENQNITKTRLGPGEKITKTEGYFKSENITDSVPPWMNGESVFKNTSLYVVLNEMEIQYGITFDMDEINTLETFTGGFIHSDLETALTTVLTPMGIRFTIDNNTISLSYME